MVSAIGCGKSASLEALRACRSGIGPVKYVEGGPEGLPVGEVPLSNEEMAALAGVPQEYTNQLPRTTLMSILALQEALDQADIIYDDSRRGTSPVASAFFSRREMYPSGNQTIKNNQEVSISKTLPSTKEKADVPGSVSLLDIPVIGGTTVGGMDITEKQYPKFSAMHSCGASTDLAVEFLGGCKFATTLSTACSSATNAIIYGANLIRSGKCQCVVAGGSESLSAYHFHGFNSLMILDKEPCRPFDASRAGLNLGEGAAYLVLETEESALKRGAKPIAVLSGWGNACDAFHQTASSENGEGAFLAMKKALAVAGLEPSAIDYVNAHGTGTPNNDPSESAAIRRIFGDSVPPVSSTKPFTGHTTSASGSIKAVFCLLAIENNLKPKQLNWSNPDPNCIVPYTDNSYFLGTGALQSARPEAAGDSRGQSPLRQITVANVICNAFGFGGNDSSIILSAYDA